MGLGLLEFCSKTSCNIILAVEQMCFLSSSQLSALCWLKQVYLISKIVWVKSLCKTPKTIASQETLAAADPDTELIKIFLETRIICLSATKFPSTFHIIRTVQIPPFLRKYRPRWLSEQCVFVTSVWLLGQSKANICLLWNAINHEQVGVYTPPPIKAEDIESDF